MYNLLKAIEKVKKEIRTKLESQNNHTDTSQLWPGLHAITGYKVKLGGIADTSMSLPDELNAFYTEQKVSGMCHLYLQSPYQCSLPERKIAETG